MSTNLRLPACSILSPLLLGNHKSTCQSFTNQNNSHTKYEFPSSPEKSQVLSPMVGLRSKEARPVRWNIHPLFCPGLTIPYCISNAEDDERTSGYLSSHMCCYLSHIMKTFPYTHTSTEIMKVNVDWEIISWVCIFSIVFFLCVLHYIL